MLRWLLCDVGAMATQSEASDCLDPLSPTTAVFYWVRKQMERQFVPLLRSALGATTDFALGHTARSHHLDV